MNWERLDGWNGLVSGEKEGGSVAEFRGRRRRFCWGILSGFLWLSLSDGKRAWKEELNEAFIRGLEAAGCELWNSNSTGAVHCS